MKVKNSKQQKTNWNALGLILLAVILVACFYLWQDGNKAKAQSAALSDNISLALAQAKAIAQPPAGLSSQLDSAESALAAAQAGFPATIDRNEVIDYLMKLAGDYNVQVMPLVSDGWVVQSLGMDYQVLKFAATASGSLKDVESYMTAVQGGKYPSLVITSFTVNHKTGTENLYPGDDMHVTVNIKIAIYTTPVLLTGDSFK